MRERTRLPARPLTYVDVSLHSNKKTKLKGAAAACVSECWIVPSRTPLPVSALMLEFF